MNEARMGQTSDGTAYFALDQYQGKGQRAKTWSSKPGENIILSVVKDCSGLQLNNQFQLSVAVALACFDFFSAYAGDETRIKWPNDLYWRDRKAGGILIENMVKSDRWDKAIIGMGININQTAFNTLEGKPVSLKQITGKAFDPIILAKELCQHLEKRFSMLANKPFDQLLSAYNAQLFKKDEIQKKQHPVPGKSQRSRQRWTPADQAWSGRKDSFRRNHLAVISQILLQSHLHALSPLACQGS
jgi:BirA family biotin operon repressor/biotin-[acetyl-CoA-carboxylase] ligase